MSACANGYMSLERRLVVELLVEGKLNDHYKSIAQVYRFDLARWLYTRQQAKDFENK